MMYSKSELAQRLGVTVRTLVNYCRNANFWHIEDRRKLISKTEGDNILKHFGGQ